MSVDKAELCGSLLTWLQTFHVPSPCTSPQDLSSGLAIAYVLNQIDPSWFNETWLQGISEDPGPNWRLKVSNLKTILQSLLEYSQDVLGHPVLEQHLPDVSLIGEFSDPEELGKLLQLVLGCAISCEKKQEHIQRIMTLEESVQHVVMEAIQELMTKDTPDSLSPETYGNFDNQSSERAGQLEATLSSCRRRLGELRELRRQVRQLEERNAGHAERTRQLEDELRRAGSLRAQLEAQRRQVQELQGQRQEEAMKAEKWLFECRNLEEKYELVTKEKERLLAERDSLREANEELRCAQLQPRGLTQADPSLDPTSPAVENLAAEILPAELSPAHSPVGRETLLRLQLENKQLCQQEAAYRERQEELQRHLEEANRARHGLETQLRQKLHEADLELQRKREYIEELEPPADSSTARRIEELQHSLQKKDADLRAMEARYRRYVDKARTVIQTLEPKQRPPGGAPPELHTLRTQLRERDVRIRHLEMDFEKSRSQREQEEKLLISAWYNMGMALQQRAGEERAPAHAQSFLAQQRLATNTRRGPLGRLASLNMRSTDKH
ncbi:protein Hook homolog 2 [Puma concolor]|uniref:Protein Hook homolog 2 n=1 Tax=Puma concolor TaxID=9696 RepID=A0A6P6H770_PUMCO|nr:protein Hook homolog 2 [Puma concolor]